MKKTILYMLFSLSCLLMCGQVYANDTENTQNCNTESNEQNDNDDSNQPVCEFTNYYCEGTEWYYHYYEVIIHDDYSFSHRRINYKEWLEGEIELDGRKYLCVWYQCEDLGENDPKLISYIRTEDNKVWKKDILKPEEPEVLIFDFNLTPGEVFQAYSYYVGEYRVDVKVVCSELVQYPIGITDGVPSLKMEITTSYPDFDITEEDITYWIYGIGGSGALDSNTPLSNRLYAVYYNGAKILDNEPSGVEALPEEYNVPIKGNKYHLDGRIFKDGDRGISISNGKKVIRN